MTVSERVAGIEERLRRLKSAVGTNAVVFVPDVVEGVRVLTDPRIVVSGYRYQRCGGGRRVIRRASHGR